MSYDPSGIYNLPPVYKATPGTTVRSEQHNAPLEDIAQALSFVLVRDGRNGMIGDLPMGGFRITNLGPGTSPTDAATVGQTLPIGAIIDFALPNAPAGWVFCAGQPLLSDTPYPLLRQALLNAGSPYGTDGAGSPRVPDYRDRVSAGRDNMGNVGHANRLTWTINGDILGNAGGDQGVVLSVDQMPPHNHGGATTAAGGFAQTITNLARNGFGPWGFPSGGNVGFDSPTVSAPNHVHGIPTQGGGQAHSNVQPTIVMNKIIKAAY